MDRRDYLKVAGTGVVAAGMTRAYGTDAMTEADVAGKYASLIPADKGLDPAWVKSLTARGDMNRVTGRKALDHIGMPVGGLFAGTVYLGGDGRLWLWNIFNNDREGIVPRTVPYKGKDLRMRDGANFISPAPRTYPFEQNFGIRIGNKLRTLDADGFSKVAFSGQYPIGEVTYEDADSPVSVKLMAYSPFIPLNTADSSLPATIMSFTVRNTGSEKIEAELIGWMANPICLNTGHKATGSRKNTIISDEKLTALVCTAMATSTTKSRRPDIVFEDFEKESYGNWVVTGTAFGKGPIRLTAVPDYQGDLAVEGNHAVNSHASAPGTSTAEKDGATGTLTSPTFTIGRRFVNVRIGGGAHENRTCVNVLIGDKVAASATGDNSNQTRWKSLDLSTFNGKEATLQIVDTETGGWGNIGIDQIVFSDTPVNSGKLDELPDFGSMTLTLLKEKQDNLLASADSRNPAAQEAEGALTDELKGSVGQQLALEPGGEMTVDFAITWYFPNLSVSGMKNVGREYAARFADALDVARYVAKDFKRLSGDTKLWRDTWYDSTLPHWFLDRTMANTSILATTTAYRFKSGRFWAWEGIGCCNGTCTHVWHYAQAPARLFPDVERRHREEVDFGIALHPDGGIGMRAGLTGANHPADDGQCGRILGAYREHQMSTDDAFLKRNWPNIKLAIQFMINRDANRDGILEGAQHNTLDAAWYGRIPFLASLYLATLRAGAAMATEMNDTAFSTACSRIADRGANTILELYNGEYFFHELEQGHADNVATGSGCYIDQVFGQFWAHQVGLGHLFDPAKIKSALASLYRYNFVPNIGKFRTTFQRGRWYANGDDKGLIMCSWPKGGLNKKWHDAWQFMYFNECMTGFEWQVAAHMISEGLVEEGMAVSRAIHDRYDASLRNPYNEIECSDHYSRSMASYGAFLSACGYESHGPKHHLGFSPALGDSAFKCAFTSAEGWGTFVQKSDTEAGLEVKWGKVKLKTLGLRLQSGARNITAHLNGDRVACKLTTTNKKTQVVFSEPITINAGERLIVKI